MMILIFLWLLLSPTSIKSPPVQNKEYFIVWNVGQGQWTTFVSYDQCQHFDLGGEFFPIQKIKRHCYNKFNSLFISHWDMDHMSALSYLKNWPRVCRKEDPIGQADLKKMNLLFGFNPCTTAIDSPMKIQKIFPLPQDENYLPDISNAKSKVYVTRGWIIPGDSRIEEEKIWSKRLSNTEIHGLILGHHGSKTSNSETLISKLSKLRMVISSSRWRRYKHPHPIVINTLKKYHKNILRTEDWGNFFFEL